MGRPEKQLDPGGGPVGQFAQALRDLRAAAGVGYRQMAAGCGYSASTLAQAASGKRLPSLPVVQAFVAACGGNAEQWDRMWQDASRAVAADAAPHDDTAQAPYRGLARFEPGDRDVFFGRDDLTAQLVRKVREHRLVAVVGASGSGKSSLLRAGLIPRLREDPSARDGTSGGSPHDTVRILRPGPHPGSLPGGLLEAGPGPGETVVVVDQFEELFTLGTDTAERTAFVDRLVAGAGEPGGRLRVVIAVRADFFGHCAQYPRLARLLREATLLVGPMDHAALRDVVVKPAAVAGLVVERSLTARLVHEAAKEPAGLPLLSHVLLEVWRRRRGRVLTERMYDDAGGVHGAIAATAEDVYTALSEPQAAVARRLLLRLVTPGEGAQDTRRPTHRSELDAAGPAARGVVERLLRARLLVCDDDGTVDLAHEALITAWPRLGSWIAEDREQLRQHRWLTEAAHTWRTLGYDPEALYRGARLKAAEDAFPESSRGAALTSAEHAFLLASIAARRREERAAAGTVRRLRALTVALSTLVVLAVTAGLLAWTQNRGGDRQAADATRHAAASTGPATWSRQVADASAGQTGLDTELSMLLAVEAYRISPTPEAVANLYRAAALPLRATIPVQGAAPTSLAFSHDGRSLALGSGDGSVSVVSVATSRTTRLAAASSAPPAAAPGARSVTAVSFTADDRSLAAAGPAGTRMFVLPPSAAAGRQTVPGRQTRGRSLLSSDARTMVAADRDGLRAWDTATGRSRALAAQAEAPLAVSPDGGAVAVQAPTRPLVVRDTATGTPLMTYAAPADVTAAAFGADGRAFACLTGSGSVAWWPRIADGGPARVLTASADPDDRPTSLALSRDGTTVAVGLSGGTILVWDAATGRRLGTLKAPAAEAVDLAFGPDGHTLASAGPQAVRLWDTGLGVPRTELSGGRQTPASAKGKPAPETHPALAFLPHGRTLATGRAGTGLDLWNADTGRLVGSLPLQSDPLWHVVADPAGSAVATVDSGGHVRLWDLRTRRVRLLGALAADAAFSPDGRTLATVLPSGHLRLWDTASGALRKEADVGDGDDTLYTSLAYSPDGHTLAARDSDGNATLVNPDADGTLRVLSTGPVAHHDLATAAYGSLIAFSPDGRTLAVLGRGPDTLVWDVPSGRLEATLQADAGSVTSLAFSPDGRSLVVGGSDGTARVWDMSGHRVRAGYTAGTEPVTSVAFSPDGDAVATRSGDGTTHVWSAHLPDGPAAVQEICAAVHRDLTPRERQRFTPRGAPAHPCPASRG